MPPRAKPEWPAWCRAEDLSVDGSTVDVRLPDGRHHRVSIEELPDTYRLTAKVASPSALRNLPEPELDIWCRNRTLQLVGFYLDRHHRLIGESTVPRSGLADDEFRFYLLHLARECDRLEALLTGADEE